MNKFMQAGMLTLQSRFSTSVPPIGMATNCGRPKLSCKNRLKQLDEHLEPGSEIETEACGGSHHWARLAHLP